MNIRELRKKLSKKRKKVIQKSWTHGAPSKMSKNELLRVAKKLGISDKSKKKKRKRKRDADLTESDEEQQQIVYAK